jgi:hypothetical protein
MADDDDWESAWDSGVPFPRLSWLTLARLLKLVSPLKNDPTQKRSRNETRNYGMLRTTPFIL